MKIQEYPALDYPIIDKMGLGVYSDAARFPGTISLYEEHSVRVDRGYTLGEWKGLTVAERAFEVAFWRSERAIEYAMHEKSEQASKRSARR